MKGVRLRTRFLWAGGLLVAAAVAGSLGTAAALARLADAVDDTVRHSQAVVDLAAALHGSLEREDDALLLFLGGQAEQARRELADERQRGEAALARLAEHMRGDPADQQDILATLNRAVEDYRAAGDALVATVAPDGGLEAYHRQVNPRLRQAVAACDRLREWHFRSMQQAGLAARDEAVRGTRLVVAITLLATALGGLTAGWLARSVLGPIRELTASVEAIRQGHFEHRVPVRSGDELGQLADGFNRMAEALDEYRQSSLGELLVAKMTLEATLNALPEAVLVFDPEATLAAANPPARHVLTALGCATAARLADIPLPAAYRAAIETALAGMTPSAPLDLSRTLTLEVDGRPRRLLMRAVPIPRFARGRHGAVAVFDDVTDFVRLDELRSELIGTASHELKSPLTSLRMNLLMLSEGSAELPERHRQLLAAAVAGCEELGRTVEELLDVSRIEAGQLRLDRVPVDPAAVLATVVSALQPRFDDAGVKLVIEDTLGPAPPPLRADPARLASVLTNVLANALKYSPPGGVVRVRLTTGQTAGGGPVPVLHFAVTDQGPGVPAEFRERIFEKFFRVEHHRPSGRKDVRGTGIGLYLCRQIVEAHGGTIACQAGDDGRGTRIVITLPCGC